MNPVSSVLVLMGASLALLAGIGLLKFSTPYARFHAAGKASPVAFLLVALGAGIEIGGAGAVQLGVAVLALLVTLPAATHLLFRATHASGTGPHLAVDALRDDEARAAAPTTDPDSTTRPTTQGKVTP